MATIWCVAAMLAGCADARQPVPHRYGSLKDDLPKAEAGTKTEVGVAAPGGGAAVDTSVEERARREQAETCGQRHLEHSTGTLTETQDQKRARDDQCTELHKRDYVQ